MGRFSGLNDGEPMTDLSDDSDVSDDSADVVVAVELVGNPPGGRIV